MECSPKSTFHFFVPQAVNQGVEHWDDHSVEHRGNFISVHGLPRARLQVHEDDRAIEDGHGSEMGGTGGDSLLSALGRAHALNSNAYEEIRDDDNQESREDIKAHDEEHNQLADASVGACKSQEWGHVAEKMIHFIGPTEGKSEGVCCVD